MMACRIRVYEEVSGPLRRSLGRKGRTDVQGSPLSLGIANTNHKCILLTEYCRPISHIEGRG